jgi:glycosyltransferase involved in cell wall biosynthesis
MPESMSGGTPRVRVLLVGPSLDILGGQAVQAARLLSHLRELPGLEVGFLAVNPRLPGPLRALQRVKYVRTISTSIAYFASLLREVPRWDVIHAFSASYTSFLLAPLPAMIAAKLYGKRVVLNYRSGEAEDHLARSRRVAVRAMRRLADAIAVPSGYLVTVFARFGLRARSIFNFVDLDRIPFRERSSPPRPHFLSNRNLEPLYNVACVLRAFARVQREVPEARLTVAGFGSQERALHALAGELGLRNVEFTGRVAPDRMPALYDAADVYLNAPDIDNMPNSVIEAYAAGLPVVTSDAGGIPYIVRDGETGLMVPRGDDAALAGAALRVLREPGLARRLATQAREECVSRYTWAAVRHEWAELYAGLAPRTAAVTARPAAAAGGARG